MNGINLSNIRGLFFGGNTYTKMYFGGILIWPIGDYEQQYFTTVAKGSGNIGFSIPADISTSDLTSISYSTDGGATWTTTNNVNNQAVTVTVPVNNGDKVLWKGVGTATSNNLNYSNFTSTVSFDVEGNIMSLLNGDNFYHSSFASGSSYNFRYLFDSSRVVDASNLILPATTLTPYCYYGMFYSCTSLTTAPELPATTLAEYCYSSMFEACTSLTTAPELPATTLVQHCYSYMFLGCWNLNYIKMLATNISATDCLKEWVLDVAATGTFVKDADTTIPIGNSGIPTGWTVQNIVYYERHYFTTIAKGSGNIVFSIPSGVTTSDLTSISYSTDNGSTWTTTNNVDGQVVSVTVPINNGDKVLWKGVGTKTYHNYNNFAYFTSTVSFDVEGNIMSLLNGDNFYQSSFASGSSYNFADLFRGTNVVDASNLILPATLTSACFYEMFYHCTSLTTAPELPATTLANNCYYYMFNGCTSLTAAPELSSTTLTQYCYFGMFRGCTNLNYIKMLATDISAYNCLSGWVNGVSASGTFVKDANTTIPTSDSGIPSGWTVQNQ